MSVFGLFLICIYTLHLFVFSPNTEKYGPEKLRLGTLFTRCKDKDVEQEIGNFLIPNIQNYSPLQIIDDYEEFICLTGIDKIINNLDIKKAPGID